MSPDPKTMTILELGAAYRAGRLTPREVTEAYLAAVEQGPVYLRVTAARARRQAEEATRCFEAGIDAGPLQGVPIAIKDLVDTAGEVTSAGSKVLARRQPATEDAPIAARLDAAGAVFLGKTNMTELAFSGIGVNPHFGTPANALDADRVPGGSSSGSAVAVARNLACAAVGTDTGGSVRIPSAFQGLVGLKTTDRLLPMDGCQPLSTTLDTVGPIARTVEDAWALLQAMCAAPPAPLPSCPERLRLLVPTTVVLDDADAAVEDAFERAIARIEEAGHVVERRPLPHLHEIVDLYRTYGSFANHEAYALYEEMIERDGAEMDPRVSRRVEQFRDRPSRDYIRLGYARARIQRATWDEARPYHAVVAPTVAIQAPRLDALEDDEAYFAANAMCLRNTMLFNVLGGPAASVPGPRTPNGLPIGLMIATPPGTDGAALAVAKAVAGAAADRAEG